MIGITLGGSDAGIMQFKFGALSTSASVYPVSRLRPTQTSRRARPASAGGHRIVAETIAPRRPRWTMNAIVRDTCGVSCKTELPLDCGELPL